MGVKCATLGIQNILHDYWKGTKFGKSWDLQPVWMNNEGSPLELIAELMNKACECEVGDGKCRLNNADTTNYTMWMYYTKLFYCKSMDLVVNGFDLSG